MVVIIAIDILALIIINLNKSTLVVKGKRLKLPYLKNRKLPSNVKNRLLGIYLIHLVTLGIFYGLRILSFNLFYMETFNILISLSMVIYYVVSFLILNLLILTFILLYLGFKENIPNKSWLFSNNYCNIKIMAKLGDRVNKESKIDFINSLDIDEKYNFNLMTLKMVRQVQSKKLDGFTNAELNDSLSKIINDIEANSGYIYPIQWQTYTHEEDSKNKFNSSIELFYDLFLICDEILSTKAKDLEYSYIKDNRTSYENH